MCRTLTRAVYTLFILTNLSALVFAEGPNYLTFFQPIKMPAASTGVNAAQVQLGQLLFHEKRISKNHDISCNSCHTLSAFGVDGEPTSLGHKGVRGGRNSPTVLNAFAHLAQFWDGRAADVEAQAKGPVLNPVEMAMPSAEAVEETLKSIPGYLPLFKRAFPEKSDPITYDHFAKAVGAFERQLATPGRFDQFLKGDKKSLSDAERKGLDTFISVGCIACHSGPYLGGMMYQKLGLVKSWPNQKDQGRFEVTKQASDRMVFKVPSLRNIAKTGPYFHDGGTESLNVAVKMMAEHQLGRTLNETELNEIVTFLTALTSAPPAQWTKTPTLPESGPLTPKPDPS